MRIDEIVLKYLNESKYILITSNKNKLKEFKRFGLSLQIEPGKDLAEVDGSVEEVIIYKAKDAGINRIVEDTSLHIDGADVGVNIRWLINSLSKYDGKKAEWIVMLGLNDGEYIKIYKGVIKGRIKPIKYIPEDAFGFDGFFVPEGSNKTLYELEQEGKKDDFSARKLAIENLKKDKVLKKIKLDSISPWKGSYQH